jgi:hypothetical protein
MWTVYCKICENRFLSKDLKGEIEPWFCPKCLKDSYENIQRDLNDLYKLIGLNAIDRMISRINRLDIVSKMLWKKDIKQEVVSLC